MPTIVYIATHNFFCWHCYLADSVLYYLLFTATAMPEKLFHVTAAYEGKKSCAGSLEVKFLSQAWRRDLSKRLNRYKIVMSLHNTSWLCTQCDLWAGGTLCAAFQ